MALHAREARTDGHVLFCEACGHCYDIVLSPLLFIRATLTDVTVYL